MRRIAKWTALPAGAAALVFLLGAAAAPGPDGFSVMGDYYETCACAVSCPCPAKFLPTEGHCDAVSLIHVRKGTAAGVSFDGLNIALVIRSPHGEKVMDALAKGKMDLLSIYLDDKANEKQREAMPRLLGALFGTKPVEGSHPPVYAPISLDVKGDVATFAIAGGQTLSAEIENVDASPAAKGTSAKKAKRVTLVGAAPFPWVTRVTQGFSHSFRYDDHGTKWEYKDRNAFFGSVQANGKLPPEKKA